jgi:hypothetical protein
MIRGPDRITGPLDMATKGHHSPACESLGDRRSGPGKALPVILIIAISKIGHKITPYLGITLVAFYS